MWYFINSLFVIYKLFYMCEIFRLLFPWELNQLEGHSRFISHVFLFHFPTLPRKEPVSRFEFVLEMIVKFSSEQGQVSAGHVHLLHCMEIKNETQVVKTTKWLRLINHELLYMIDHSASLITNNSKASVVERLSHSWDEISTGSMKTGLYLPRRKIPVLLSSLASLGRRCSLPERRSSQYPLDPRLLDTSVEFGVHRPKGGKYWQSPGARLLTFLSLALVEYDRTLGST